MRNILARANQPILEQFACSRVLLAFDYDGTLAPIVAEPAAAALRPRTRRLLADVARLYPCVVISGRARRDTLARLEGVRVRAVVGNHGVEPHPRVNGFARRTVGWRESLERVLAGLPGVTVEDKGLSIAIHYRRARAKKRTRAAAVAAAASLGPVRIVGGKDVVNVLPMGAPHKGDALERERERLGCDTAIYVGDDDTDEDVFRLDQPGRLLTIRVGRRRASMADYCIRDQTQIDQLLELLLRAARDHLQPRSPV